MDDPAALAQFWGIEREYQDIFGRRHSAKPETLARLIAAMSDAGLQPKRFDEANYPPTKTFQGDGRRYWVLAVQLYSVRSARNWGHGDFTDLSQLIELAAQHGAAAVGLNPLHALFAGQASPYFPSSRRFLNVLYIDVEKVPEFSGIATSGLSSEIETLRSSQLIDYARVARAKLVALRAAYDSFRANATPERRSAFEHYRAEQGDAVARFACFEYLRERFAPQPWTAWPQPFRKPTQAGIAAIHAENTIECEFYEFIQWLADSQLTACCAHARACGLPIGLYVDFAVGIDPYGADAWSRQDAILPDVSIGAPPDDFNPSGQNWGLAPFNPHALSVDDFAHIRALLGASMRYAGAVRIDHALGLKRMFMIPRGMDAADGAYVRFPFADLLRVLAEESRRYQCIVIGEDLGTVPEDFRAALSLWGLWMYRVMLFERLADGRLRPPDTYPADALATLNTHDMPTFAAWIHGDDLRLRAAIGAACNESAADRMLSLAALRVAINDNVGARNEIDMTGVAEFLANTPSRLVSISLEDILGASYQVNIPGTLETHPNWRHRLPDSLESLNTHLGLRRIAQAFAQAGRAFFQH